MRGTLAMTLALFVCYASTAVRGAQSVPAKIVLAASPESDVATETKQSAVRTNQAVITIQGACGKNPPKETHGADCNQTVTREAFESLLDALNPGGKEVSADARRNLASAYAQLAALDIAGKKAGLEDTVKFHELLNWLRLRAVADLYRLSLQQKYSTPPSQAEIDAYYKQHLASFERVHLARIFIPRENYPPADNVEFEKKAAAAAQTARKRAAKQEDPGEIQKDVYQTLGVKLSPATDMGTLRRAEFVEKEQQEVFSLKPGEVTQVETEPKSYIIYKVLSKDMLSEEQANAEIAHNISQDKFNHELQSDIDAVHAQFDEAYFGGSVSVAIPTLTLPMPARAAGH